MTSNATRSQFERSDLGTTEAVVASVGAVLDTDPNALPPLQRAVDVEALDRLWTEEHRSGVIDITFEYADCLVTVAAGGTLTVDPLAD